MRDVILACDSNNYVTGQAGYRGPQRQEYYEGDYQILPGANLEVRIEKCASCTFPIMNLWASSELRFRRSWNHIRSDNTDLSIVWFVKRGRLAVSDHGGRHLIESGECTITRSLQPFYIENLVDKDSVHEALHVVVPTHALRSYIPDSVSAGAAFSFRQGNCLAGERTLQLLYEQGPSIEREVADQLERAALSAVGRSMAQSTQFTAPPTLGELRFHQVIDCIQTQLTNPTLTASVVAHACGISTRYLCHLMQLHDTSFSEILWKSRIERAKSWLLADNMRHVSVARIAYMAGFKSPATFSRMFKRVTKLAPRDYRDCVIVGDTQ
jgi:AraC family transcriptional activator of tynA and feaB